MSQGAFWGLMGGMCLGTTRLILEMFFTEPRCGESDLRPIYVRLHYMYVALILFAVSSVIVVVLSLLTKPPTKQMVSTT